MTKKVSYTDEEEYDHFEIYESEFFLAFKVSDKLFERYNKIHCLAEEMRRFIETKQRKQERRVFKAK